MKKRHDGSITYEVKEDAELLPFLLSAVRNKSRNSVKSMLKRGQAFVDGKPVTAHNFELKKGQKVEVVDNPTAKIESALTGIDILYEDEDLIVIEKEAGLLTMAGKNRGERTAYSEVMEYVRGKNLKDRIFIVHRLDRETSGVLLFAKDEQVKNDLQNNWNEVVKERMYTALVEGNVKRDSGTVKSYLKESKTFKVYSNKTDNGGQLAITHYTKIRSNSRYSLLRIELATGRKNQIRVHMEEIGHPVAGDRKYGAATNPMKRIGLHATALTIIHPRTKKEMRFESAVPKEFVNKSL